MKGEKKLTSHAQAEADVEVCIAPTVMPRTDLALPTSVRNILLFLDTQMPESFSFMLGGPTIIELEKKKKKMYSYAYSVALYSSGKIL